MYCTYNYLCVSLDLLGNIKPEKTADVTLVYIWVVTCHQYEISAVIPQISFWGKTTGGIAKC